MLAHLFFLCVALLGIPVVSVLLSFESPNLHLPSCKALLNKPEFLSAPGHICISLA